MPLDIAIEKGPHGPLMGHWLQGPGCCWLASCQEKVLEDAAKEIKRYYYWRQKHQPDYILPADRSIRLIEEVYTKGGAVGESGSQMAILGIDFSPPDNGSITEYFDIAEFLWKDMLGLVKGINTTRLTQKPGPHKRSICETLEHLGNCIWWYCSRIGAELPQWEKAYKDDIERITDFFTRAREFCLQFPQTERTVVFVPQAYQTEDPEERWTLGKVIRRQAEHYWEHLFFLERQINDLKGV